jgi:hypothetical protein
MPIPPRPISSVVRNTPVVNAGAQHTPLLRHNTSAMLADGEHRQIPGGLASRTALCCLGMFLLVEMFNFVAAAPLTALFENILCDSYYRQNRPEQPGQVSDCKIESIQKELAALKGWKGFFDTLPGLPPTNRYDAC